MNLTELAKKIEQAQRARRTAAHSKPYTPTRTPATSLGYRCERRIVYQRTGALCSPVGDELASIFEEGNLHQSDVRRELSILGFEAVEAELAFEDKRLDVKGVIDCKILFADPSARHGQRRVPAEIKSTSGSAPASGDEWARADGLLSRYYAQVQTYLYLTSEPEGLGLFKNKITGLWSVVPVALDYEYTEGLLRRAERVRDAVTSGATPDRLADRSECPACPYRDTVCHPAEAECEPTLLANDATLAAQLLAREEVKPARDGWEAIDESIKTRFKNTKGERFVCGDFLITKKPHGKGTRIDIKRLSANDGPEAV